MEKQVIERCPTDTVYAENLKENWHGEMSLDEFEKRFGSQERARLENKQCYVEGDTTYWLLFLWVDNSGSSRYCYVRHGWYFVDMHTIVRRSEEYVQEYLHWKEFIRPREDISFEDWKSDAIRAARKSDYRPYKNTMTKTIEIERT